MENQGYYSKESEGYDDNEDSWKYSSLKCVTIPYLFKEFIQIYYDVERKLNDPSIKEMISEYNDAFLATGWIIFSNLMYVIIPTAVFFVVIFHNSNLYSYYSMVISRTLLVLWIRWWGKLIIETPIILNNIFAFLVLLISLLSTFENLAYDQPKLLEISMISYFWMFVIISVWCFQYKKSNSIFFYIVEFYKWKRVNLKLNFLDK